MRTTPAKDAFNTMPTSRTTTAHTAPSEGLLTPEETSQFLQSLGLLETPRPKPLFSEGIGSMNYAFGTFRIF